MAEIGLIRLEESLRVVKLPPTQRALFMELQQQLDAQDMRIIRGGRSKNDGDRVKRINQVLRASKSAEEALLKCAAFFVLEEPTSNPGVDPEKLQPNTKNTSEVGPGAEGSSKNRASDSETLSKESTPGAETSDQNASESQGVAETEKASDLVIRTRKAQKQDLRDELKIHLRHAEWLLRQCGSPSQNPKSDTHYRNWKAGVQGNEFGDPDGTAELIRLIVDAERGYSPSDEDEFYKDQPTEEEIRKQKLILKKKKAKEAAAKAAKKREKALKNKKRKEEADDESEDSASAAENNPGDDDGDDVTDEELLIFNDPRPFKIAPGDYPKFVQTLRILAGHLRVLAKELISRERALRFLETVQNLQLWQSEEGGPAVKCESCSQPNLNPEDCHPSEIRVLGLCGHVACVKCLTSQDRNGQCLVDKCNAPAEDHHIHLAQDFNEIDDRDVRYGAKLDAIIDLIKSISGDDQVLLFVQFEDLMRNVAGALEKENISYYAIYNSQSKNAVQEMDRFQQDESDQKKKVLILNPSNESAAGL